MHFSAHHAPLFWQERQAGVWGRSPQERILTKPMKNKGNHIVLDHIAEYVRGALPAGEQPAIREHLAECAQCASQHARIARVFEQARADETEDVPAHVVARAKRLMAQARAGAPLPARRVPALLRFDSLRMAAARSARSSLAGVRQLVFETGQYDLVVHIKPLGEQQSIWGQLLGPSTTGMAELHGPASAQAALNAQGEFTLPPLPPGAYELLLLLDDVEISAVLETAI
jgi:hypothetical protein